jgi:hypothetical protein
MELVRQIKIYLNENYGKVWIGKNLSEWSETRRCFIATAFQFFFTICHPESLGKSRSTEAE